MCNCKLQIIKYQKNVSNKQELSKKYICLFYRFIQRGFTTQTRNSVLFYQTGVYLLVVTLKTCWALWSFEYIGLHLINEDNILNTKNLLFGWSRFCRYILSWNLILTSNTKSTVLQYEREGYKSINNNVFHGKGWQYSCCIR